MFKGIRTTHPAAISITAVIFSIALGWTISTPAQSLLGGIVDASIDNGGGTISIGGGSGGSVAAGLGSGAGSGNVASAPGTASVGISGGNSDGGISVGSGGGVNILGGAAGTSNNSTTTYNSRTNISTSTRGYSASSGGAASPSIQRTGISRKVAMLLNIMKTRMWLSYMNGRAVCLRQVSVAEVGGWVSDSDMQSLQQMLVPYAQDIVDLRKLLDNCPGQRQAVGQSRINRAIAVDFHDGKPVLWVL